MKQTIYLVVTHQGVQRFTKKPSSLAADEHRVRLDLTIPDEAFERYTPTVSVVLETEHLVAGPPVVTVEPVAPQGEVEA